MSIDDTTTAARPQVPWVFGIWLIIAGVIGEIAAFILTMEKIHVLSHPEEAASCDISPVVQCTANLLSWQGSLFGFPNPLIGLVGWMAPIVVGAALLAGARFSRWFWVLFNLGMTGALAFVIFLITQSIYSLGTLCIWCLTTWSVTIPTFLAVTFRNLAEGVFGERPRGFGRAVLPWVAPITILILVIVLLLAQLQFSFIQSLFTGLT